MQGCKEIMPRKRSIRFETQNTRKLVSDVYYDISSQTTKKSSDDKEKRMKIKKNLEPKPLGDNMKDSYILMVMSNDVRAWYVGFLTWVVQFTGGTSDCSTSNCFCR